MAHAAHPRRSSGFTSFVLGVLLTLVVIGGTIYWLGLREPISTVEVGDVGIPLPELPAPPGTIPAAEAPPAP
jgi:hypothetical protein